MGIEEYLPLNHTQEEINPEKPGDYMENGILHCGVCREPKQYRFKIGNVERVVPCICRCIREKEDEQREKDERREQIARLKEASMMPARFRDADFDSYIRRKENEPAYSIAVNYCNRWQEMKKKNQGLLFYGPVGTGKSYTAACIANQLMDQMVSVIMTSFVKILQDIKVMEDESTYMAILNSASLLIIDDLGTERNTEYGLEKVYNVIDSRVHEDKPMILTTNLDLSQMIDCSDIRCKRIYDRILEVCFPVEIAGQSFREEEASKRFDEMKKLLIGGQGK